MSTSSPIPNPAAAPSSDPHSSPTDIATSGVMSADTPKMEIWETPATWITTARNDTSARRTGRRKLSPIMGPALAAGRPGAAG